MRIAEDLGVEVDVVAYLKTPPDAVTLASIIAKLDDPVTALVRRDAKFASLGLTDADVQTPEQVIAVIAAHKALLQRPLVVTPERALIGRPKDRVRQALAPYATRTP